ncbi:MAG TPA: protein kinase [Polyangia bacterium]|nr:protein kinase [Polyangia bacterium]
MIERVVAGRFQLLAQAGAGGMGAVYRARDLATGTTVAVKILTGREVREAQRFDQEGAILAGLVHPAIVRYITHGIADSGARYIAMEWLDGEDLAARLEGEHPTIAETVTLARRTAEALAYAHKRGVVHRDIKPGNLFLPGGAIDRLKVLDFGIARFTSGAGRLTRTGKVIGTPGYMAPELVRGAREITPRADVFSLGCVIFQCLTGRAVFEAEAPTALLAKILLVEAPRVRELAPHVPASVDECVARMLAKNPEDRLADAAAVLELLGALGPLGDGRAVGAASAGGATIALTASERRIACVVIAGPSATGERRWSGDTPPAGTPELEDAVLAGQLRRLIAIEDDLARRHGAHVHPLPDGSVVVSLPEQESATDQAARAARCALAMRSALPDVAFVVSTGQGRFSAWSAVGEVIDNGMRLLRGTPPGSIRLDDVAAGMLGARFEVRRDGTAAYLRAERDSIGVERQLLGKATPFVGRGREMSMLTNLFAGTVAESAATPVLVIGSAGVGKSRLRQELVEWVQRQPDRAEILFGGVDSVGAGSPFAMLARAIRRTAGIVDGEPLGTRQEKLAARVARHVDREARDRVTEFLGEIADVRFAEGGEGASEALRTARANPQLMGDGMRRAFEDWLMAECATHPVLLVLEDLHWGDLGTVSFLDSALRNLHDQPFMVLALARPEVEERFPEIWTARHRQTIRLGPLSPRASEQLVRQALGTIGDELLARLVERADGNAFYLEELIRATAAGRADALPDSVLAMVQARLDSEGPDGKRVLRAAAIFGERFSRAGLAALLLGGEAGIEDLSDALERLAAHELVTRASTPALAGDVELVFAHALIREAAYAMLTDEDRLLGHRLAGNWLEQAGSADAIVLAEHFRRGAEPSRAARWYERAAAQSLSANDLVAAIERAELGIAGGASGEQAGKLLLIAAEAHVWRGELAEAERLAMAAAADLPAGGAAWLRALAQAIVAAGKHGRLEAVEREVAEVEASPLTADPTIRSARIISLAWGAHFLVFGGRYAIADPLIATIGALAGEPDAALDPQALGLLHQVRAVRASAAGDLGRCLTGLESALQAFEQAGDLRNACAVRNNLGYMYSELGDFQRAEASLRQALGACDRMGLHDLSAAVQHNLGRVLGFGPELGEAERLERMAIEAFRRQGEPRLEGLARIYLAEILIGRGDLAAAAEEAAAAVAALVVAPAIRVAALGALARARLGGGDRDGGLAAAGEAHAALERLGEIEEGESMVRLTYAEALAAAGQEAEARAALALARQRLLARADRVADLGWRHRFLHEVPVNARILALAGEPSPPSAGSSAAA